MKLLIDADYIVYKSCAAAETEIDFGEDLIVVTSNFSDVMKTSTESWIRSRKSSSILPLSCSLATIKISEKLFPITRDTVIVRNLVDTNVLSTH